MQDRIAELEKAAYAQTDKGPMLWSEVCQGTVDEFEWYRSSLNPIWARFMRLHKALERLASSEAFGNPKAMTEEERMRITYAREELQKYKQETLNELTK